MSGHGNDLTFNQIPIWMIGILFLDNKFDEIQIGYCMNDDAISYLDDIRKIYKSYDPLFYIKENRAILKFPLSKVKKEQMVDELPEKYRKLIYTCENPKIISDKNDEYIEYEACCDCVPCKRIVESNYYGLKKFPKEYDKNLLDRSVDRMYKYTEYKYKLINKEGEEYFDKKYGSDAPLINKEDIQLCIDFKY